MAERQFSSFYVGEALFGLDILLVREITRNPGITKVDQAPDFVQGLLHLRGQIVTVLDLGVRLGLEIRTITEYSRCIVLKNSGELAVYRNAGELEDETTEDSIGLLVDLTGDAVRINSEEIAPSPANVRGIDAKYIKGVAKLADNLMIIINTGKILKM